MNCAGRRAFKLLHGSVVVPARDIRSNLRAPSLPMLRPFLLFLCVFFSVGSAHASESRVLSLSGTRFLLDGQPFPYTGISFFNALYNPEFNRTVEGRRQWIEKFKK